MQKMPVAQLVSMFDGEVHPVRERTCVIGRQSGESGITVNEGIVSREHAVIRFEDNHYLLQDSGSKNGTFLNGERLETGVCRRLRHEDIVGFSKLKYVFRILPEEESHVQVKGLAGKTEISGGQKRLVITVPEERLVAYQRKMHENNRIKGVLDASCLHAGDRVLLYYEIDGMKRFENMILKQETDEKEILKILLQITETIRGLARYLLPEDNLVLDPGMIFIDETGMVKLIHLPVVEEDARGIDKTLLSVVLFALPQLAKMLGVPGEEGYSPMQLDRFLAERLETLRQEKAGSVTETDTIKKEAGGSGKARRVKDRTGFSIKALKPIRSLLFQIPVLLLIGTVYTLRILKPIDFFGFCIITAALDGWIVKTMQKPKEESV